MRIYSDPLVAIREIERDLKEMGIEYASSTVQDKHLSGFNAITRELMGYSFMISPSVSEFAPTILDKTVLYRTPEKPGDDLLMYVKGEFMDRIGGYGNNYRDPRELMLAPATRFRESVWSQYRDTTTLQFHYTYAQRLHNQWVTLFTNLMTPGSRHAILHFFDGISVRSDDRAYPGLDAERTGGKARVPCSMYYQFLVRGDRVHMIYNMRSCDFINHFGIDLVLALKMQQFVVDRLSHRAARPYRIGNYTMNMGSLHAFASDLKEDVY